MIRIHLCLRFEGRRMEVMEDPGSCTSYRPCVTSYTLSSLPDSPLFHRMCVCVCVCERLQDILLLIFIYFTISYVLLLLLVIPALTYYYCIRNNYYVATLAHIHIPARMRVRALGLVIASVYADVCHHQLPCGMTEF